MLSPSPGGFGVMTQRDQEETDTIARSARPNVESAFSIPRSPSISTQEVFGLGGQF
jgi:hypothetical protein